MVVVLLLLVLLLLLLQQQVLLLLLLLLQKQQTGKLNAWAFVDVALLFCRCSICLYICMYMYINLFFLLFCFSWSTVELLGISVVCTQSFRSVSCKQLSSVVTCVSVCGDL